MYFDDILYLPSKPHNKTTVYYLKPRTFWWLPICETHFSACGCTISHALKAHLHSVTLNVN